MPELYYIMPFKMDYPKALFRHDWRRVRHYPQKTPSFNRSKKARRLFGGFLGISRGEVVTRRISRPVPGPRSFWRIGGRGSAAENL